MKTLKISNGEIRKGYELKDLAPQVKEKVIAEHLAFIENNRHEWESEDEFDAEYAEENIELNEYLFDEEGEIIYLLTYTGEHPKAPKTVYVIGTKEYDVEFIK